MEEKGNQNCPLCNTPTSFIFYDYHQIKIFSCSKCKMFVISNKIEKRLNSIDQHWKNQLSKASCETGQGNVLNIYEGPDGSNIPIQTSIEPRSNWI